MLQKEGQIWHIIEVYVDGDMKDVVALQTEIMQLKNVASTSTITVIK